MPIACLCRATIKASPADCFTALADAKGWTEWARDLDRVDVLDSGGESGPARVRATVTIMGVEKTLLVDVSPEADLGTLSFTLVEGAGVDNVQGRFAFSPVGGGALMTTDIRITLSRAQTTRIERLVSRRIETALTRDFVRYVERAGRARKG